LRATAGRDDRSPYERRHCRAYETGRSDRFPGDRRRGRMGKINCGGRWLARVLQTLRDAVDACEQRRKQLFIFAIRRAPP